MTSVFVLYDDATARAFEPFALTRPAGELRAGAELIRERWARALGATCSGFVSAPHLAAFREFDAPPAISQTDTVPTGTWLVNARCAPVLGPIAAATDATTIRCNGRVAAVRSSSAPSVAAIAAFFGDATPESPANGKAIDVEGWWLDEVWDLIRHLGAMLDADARALIPAGAATPGALTVLGAHPAHVEPGATVEPFVVADTTAGPVLVRRGATVQSFTRLVGPCIVGEHATIVGGRIAASSIGPMTKVSGELNSTVFIGHANKGHDGFVVADTKAGPVLIRRGATVQSFTRLVGPCIVGEHATIVGGRIAASSIGPMTKVSGELNSTVFIGHANKGHDGFVGHSVIGRWANLGAGTITSNLKNSYGEVACWTPSGVRATGLQFLGALIGDHVKTGIGTRLTTGCVVGAGANLFGTRMPPKVVPPFAWGDGEPWGLFALDRFLTVAERVMGRRDVKLSDQDRQALRAAFDARWAP